MKTGTQGLTIVIPSLPPRECSPNSRTHWSERSRAVQVAKDEVIALIREQGWARGPLERAAVSFKYGLPDKRRRDLDNLIGASKPYLDALTGIVIADDNYRNITLSHSWFYSPKKPQTIIEVLTPLENEAVNEQSQQNGTDTYPDNIHQPNRDGQKSAQR